MYILEELISDHGRLRRLLIRFEHELSDHVDDGAADLRLLQDITAYYAEYFNRFHHPLEDRLFAHLKRFKPERWEVTQHAGNEHAALQTITERLHDRLTQAVNGTIQKRAELIECGWQFCTTNRSHMHREETEPFVQAEHYLTVADWRALSAEADRLRTHIGLDRARREYDAILENMGV